VIFCWGLGFLTRLTGFGFGAASATRVGLGLHCESGLARTSDRAAVAVIEVEDVNHTFEPINSTAAANVSLGG
jgi:hypothetical protein